LLQVGEVVDSKLGVQQCRQVGIEPPLLQRATSPLQQIQQVQDLPALPTLRRFLENFLAISIKIWEYCELNISIIAIFE
jgi:hypothetical protein